MDESGAPIAGARVELNGITTKAAVTDNAGKFTITGLTTGLYLVRASKAGFQTAVQNDVALFSGQTTTLAIQMGAITFTSLRTIATVRTTSHAMNTTPASVNVVSTSTFINQAQPQVTRVLSQIPGVQDSFPSNSANAASPGSITVPNIRDATSYETASLIDGHPISVGQYGDNVTTFLNPFLFGSVEVVKGPGAQAPEVNNAIGGTLNFRTKDPTLKPYAQVLLGVDNRGGTLSNFEDSDTIGNLGFIVDLATDNNPSPLYGKQVYYDPAQAGGYLPDGSQLGDAGPKVTVPGTKSSLPLQPQLLACCWTLDGSMNQTAELAKLTYKLSPVTRMSLSYLGSQTTADQNGNTGNFYDAVFSPAAGYSGPLKAGQHIMYASIYPGARQGEFNNEPIFQGEISSAIGNDSVAARYFNATISRYQYGGTSSSGYDWNNISLYGTNSGGGQTTFNGGSQLVQYWDNYKEPELDKLQGESFEYEHPFATNDLLTFSGEWTAAQTSDYYTYANAFAAAPMCTICYGWSIPKGTHQELGTYLVRGTFALGPKLTATWSNYFNTYSSTYAINCPTDDNNGYTRACSKAAVVDGTGVTFATTKNRHYDPRLSFVFRPNTASSIRFAAGSSIAPPFLGLLSAGGALRAPVYDPASGVALESTANQTIKPETGFGYDLGADVRLHNDVLVSGDVYLTNLFNRFFNETVYSGQTCGQTNNCSTGAPASTPIFNQTSGNISNARFEGIELGISRTPLVGLGFNIQGALNRGYYYNLPPNFYCSFVVTANTPCNPSTYDQNVNIIAGQNTNGISVGYYDAGISYNGNMRIPYANGNAEVNYTFPNQMYVSFGETYYGKNNSLNRPPFFLGYATLRIPFSKMLAFQISGDNIFNAYPGILPVYGAGVPIPLANGGVAATNGNVLGPATWRFMITTRP